MRRETRVRRSYAALAAAGMIAFATGSVGSVEAQTNIVEGFVSHGALQWPECIANEFGWFKENGATVDMVVIEPGAAQQLAAGALNLGTSGQSAGGWAPLPISNAGR